MTFHARRWMAGMMMFAAAHSPAQVSRAVFLEELTSPEVEARIAAASTTIIIPVGGTEQNGPHMALGKHNMRARVLSEKIAIALGNALVAPVMAYVPEGSLEPRSGHMHYPGTITIPADTYRKVVEWAARSFKLHGFRDIVLLGDSGDYQKDNLAVAERLNREWAATPVRVHAIREYYQVPTAWYARTLQQRGFATDEIGTHAGLADTSLTLALDPGMVRRDQLHVRDKPLTGVSGQPQRATAELGQVAVDAIVSQTVAAIAKATARGR